MTAIDYMPHVADRPDLLRRRITGTATEVASAVALIQATGCMVSATSPRQIGPGHVTVVVRYRDGLPAESPTPRQTPARRWVKPLIIGGSILTVVAGLIVGGYLAAQQIVAATSGAGLAAIGFLVVVLALFLLIKSAGRDGTCMGLHCSGCGHR